MLGDKFARDQLNYIKELTRRKKLAISVISEAKTPRERKVSSKGELSVPVIGKDASHQSIGEPRADSCS